MKLPPIPRSLRGKRVLLRLDLNISADAGAIEGDFRLQRVLPTIKKLSQAGARVVILSHLGGDGRRSLRPITRALNKFVNTGFIPRLESLKLINSMPEGGVMLLENLRRSPGEERNDALFAKRLAAHGDIYINDAFASSHREHASIVTLPKLLPAYAGPVLREEIKNLSALFKPEKPFLLIVGGAKFETKLPLIKKFLPKATNVFIGGKPFTLPPELARSKKVILPADVVTKNGKIMDAGPLALKQLENLVAQAKTILWNGTLGWYETGFAAGTEALAKMIAASGARSVIGGGDTTTIVGRLKLLDRFSFVSTGGGAMLDFLVDGKLPGIEALLKKNSARGR